MKVILGEHTICQDPDCSTAGHCSAPIIERNVDKIIIHENYKTETGPFDIALLRLDAPIHLHSEDQANVIIRFQTLWTQSFTSKMADLCQDINTVSSFSTCLNGTFP